LKPDVAAAIEWEGEPLGVLIRRVFEDSPADRAGLRGSYRSLTINGEQILVGGDVIIRVDEETVGSMSELQAFISDRLPGDEISLTIVRDGEQAEVEATLAARPDS
jgi:serine protease Do